MLTSIIRIESAAASASPAASPFFEVAQAGLVAVMAVGDEHRLRPSTPVTALTTCWSVTGQSRLTTPR